MSRDATLALLNDLPLPNRQVVGTLRGMSMSHPFLDHQHETQLEIVSVHVDWTDIKPNELIVECSKYGITGFNEIR